jgi:hypothetical protein
MASNELKAFLGSIDQRYVQYADQLHLASFTDVKELAAASPERLEQRANVPIGPAGAIVKAAGAFWISIICGGSLAACIYAFLGCIPCPAPTVLRDAQLLC